MIRASITVVAAAWSPLTGRGLRRCLSEGLGLAFIEPWLGVLPFVMAAATWLVPDSRVERYLEREGDAVSD